MPSLKAIRKRIFSVKSTQKITRAMKMVAGARLNRAQQRITDLRPYAVKTHELLAEIVRDAQITPAQTEVEAAPEEAKAAVTEAYEGATADAGWSEKPAHPLLVKRAEKRVLLVVLTSDRGLCGAFNTNINKRAEREWKSRTEQGQEVKMILIGRKGRDYFTRRGAPILEFLPGVWDSLSLESAQAVGKKVLAPFNAGEIDSIYFVYNEFKSAMSQRVSCEPLLPVAEPPQDDDEDRKSELGRLHEFIFEPNKEALLDRLLPMYVDISILRALYESMASEFGARMTAMDAATKNAKDMVDRLTLQYNRARQAAITKELMEIIGGSEALKE
ncbi:MAG: ATP synthase F1 subunit gamma [Polyangiaceae bacterium]